ncbi:MAG: helix-turn-helix transcriptional regulator [Defluviitaleaceae bacterium]|nr:helix-turn-helix transcriptional regulator [Defluviitaleaceae bacterium]
MRIDRITFAAEMTRREMRDIRLAELSGVSRSTISAIRGGKSVAKGTIEKIAMTLQVPVEQLLEQQHIEGIKNE